MKKFVWIFLALAFFAPISISAQSAAANKAWAPFFTKFKTALKSKSKTRLKDLMCSEAEWGNSNESSRDEFLQMVVRERWWDDLLRDANRGVKYYSWDSKPGRVTLPEKQGSILFAFLNGKWGFIALMGD